MLEKKPAPDSLLPTNLKYSTETDHCTSHPPQ